MNLLILVDLVLVAIPRVYMILFLLLFRVLILFFLSWQTGALERETRETVSHGHTCEGKDKRDIGV